MLAGTLVPGAVAPASAEVDWIGPVAANGFPGFFDDGNVKLRLCDNGPANGCLGDLAAVPPEAFWFNATATGGNLVTYAAVLEAAYLNGVAVPGEEIGISETRFTLRNLVPGATYTITHPYGVDTFIADTRGRIDQLGRGGFACDPEPGVTTCDWNGVGRGFLGGFGRDTMATFLKQVDAPAGRLGDINSPSPVTGAPSGTNAVIVTGPDAGGVGVNTLTITDFAVQGVTTLAAAGTPTMPDLVAASDHGRSNTDNITNATLPTFAGTIDGFAGSEVQVDLLVDGVLNGTTTTVNGGYSVTATTPLADGPRRVEARSGALTSTTRPIIVDTTAPVVTLGTHPTNNTANRTPTFTFTKDDASATFECRLLPSVPAFAPCDSPKTFAAQIDGDYTFNVRASDVAGNVSKVPAFTWRIGAAVTRLSDFNRDGRTDLLGRDRAGVLWLYPGNSTGGFLPRRRMGGGWNGITAIVTPGDVTGDGNADVMGRTRAGALRLYPGNGTGGLSASRQIGSGWNSMTAITAAGLMSGDNRPDVLARDSAGRLWLYPTTSAGSLMARRLIGGGWNAMTAIMGAGDFSGDTKADLLARDRAGKLWLYRGDGTGRFSARTTVGTGWAGMTALITPGNWDRSGGNDVIARDASGTLWLFPGNNAGKLTARRQLATGFRLYTIA